MDRRTKKPFDESIVLAIQSAWRDVLEPYPIEQRPIIGRILVGEIFIRAFEMIEKAEQLEAKK